ncbi:PTS system mannose/fructose/sorbose family transporter subunit IID [Eubacteriales bacterium OttesenSCG-928-N14]|nr:PTS system mannose/fructose/sorbose family transporter subunit IID [Eubacteriales bacterium OttesenSCG-928-N14]
MGISLFQALFCGAYYYFMGSAWCFGLGFYAMSRGLVSGLVIGLVMGDPVKGMLLGANINLIYIGNISAGGATPSDSSAAAILGVAFGIANNMDYGTAVAVALPLGMIFNFRSIFHMTFNAVFAHRGLEMAAKGDRKGLFRWQVLIPQFGYFVTGFTPVFLAAYLGAEPVGAVLDWMPQWLMDGFNAVGGMMPALGICMNLNAIGRKETMPFFILGFVLINYFQAIGLTVIVVAILGGIIAYVAVVGTGVHGTTIGPISLAAEEKKQVEGAKKLAMKDVRKSWVNWTFFSHSCYNFETMQALSFCYAISNCLEKLYEGEEFAEALVRHTVFFNTEPTIGAIIHGVTIAMEEEKANGGDVSSEAIIGIKTGLMGPFAGMGDTLVQGILTPMWLGIFISMAIESETILAPILFSVINISICLTMSVSIMQYGYRFGSNAVDALLNSGLMNLITSAAGILGCMVMGAMAAQFVRVRTPLEWTLIEANPDDPESKPYIINLQKDFFDKLLLGFLPLGTIFTIYALMKRGVRVNRLLLGLVLVAGVLGCLGVISG